MKLSGATKIHELLTIHPFLEDFLAGYDPKFEMLRNRMARATIGRVATLRTAAGIANRELGAMLEAVAAEIERRTGQRPEMDSAAAAETGPEGTNRAQRLEALKSIIKDLHDGGDLERAKQRFAEAVEDVEASEIATMEEELIRGGLPVSEVQRLCDVHVGAFRQALDEHAEADVPPGHPVHTYRAANRVVTAAADELAVACRSTPADLVRATAALERLTGLENHYQRKENQLFSVLERHGVTGPSKVMWGVHDQIRAQLKAARDAARAGDSTQLAAAAPALARDIVEMVYKEEKILFPLALQTLSADEWAEIRRGEDELGYVLAAPAAAWPGGATATAVTPARSGPATERLELSTGALSLEQVNLLLTHLPVDLSFVDETDTVRYYSESPERIFPRSPAVIGRKVQNCHPPKSVHVVQGILDSFRAGKKDVAEFWIQLQGRFINIRYFAVRDRAGAYRGCLEVSQDVTHIRSLEGERRLLAWLEE